MPSEGIPADVRRLVGEHIDSAEQLEILLLLRERADRSWSAAEVRAELHTGPESTGERLERLARSGLVRRDGPQERYRWLPSPLVDRLAETYAKRRVAVIELIFAKPADSLTTFADAFKFRRRKE